MAAKPLILKGLRQTIGSGTETNVWRDNWIPTIPARPALDNGCFRDPELKVHHLIDFVSKEWNLELLNAFIDPEDVPRILSIRPSRRLRRDSVCWDYTKSGQYSVRSGYKVAMDIDSECDTREITEPSIKVLKKQVWKVRTTRKIKHFLWQTLSGCVATTSKLNDRHCGNDRACPRCGASEENINHLLFECPPARQCWALSPIPSTPGSFPWPSLYQNMDYLLSRVRESGIPQENTAMFPWLIWYIWKARNDKVFKGVETIPPTTLNLAVHEAESWRLAQVLEETEETEDNLEDERGSHTETEPSAAVMRCQVDASWSHNAKTVGFGFVKVQGTATVQVGLCARPNNRSPLHAEMESLTWAMKKMVQQNILSIHFETDCAQLLKILNEVDEWPSLSTELEDFLTTRDLFVDFTISFIPRLHNVRADYLAKGARSRDSSFEYVDVLVPQWLGVNPNFLASTE